MSIQSKRILREISLLVADAVVVAASALLACVLTGAELFTPPFFIWLASNIVCALLLFACFGLYNVEYSKVGISEIVRTGLAGFAQFILNLVPVFIKGENLTFATVVIFVFFLMFACMCLRASKRVFSFISLSFQDKYSDKTRVMIVGGGDAGETLIRELRFRDKAYIPVCVVDDDPVKLNHSIHGIKIVGDTAMIPTIAKEYSVKEIFVAIPSASQKRIGEIVKICHETTCPVKILPSVYQLVSGEIATSKLRNVDVQDLLGRDQVGVNIDDIMSYIEDKVVMVTGGGGSIGSELCRQIALHNPKKLIILDIYENNAYDIEQELKWHFPNVQLLTLIASVRDRTKMEDVFNKYRPQIVFHAAAHKHVPLMETSPNEAVKNNVFGTLNVAECADKYGVETFVQISTDKAVNPTNIMGATKRICEMIIQALGRKSKCTKFVAVRFGNVLGSNGSVIPLFKKQIAEGGPVTVTHKEIIRYFMTIPEAVSLVLQAGSYAKDGQIFVLDMGEPVRIYDLAYNLIKLSGFEPNVDIDIVCTGLRPGEKLYEERLMAEEGLQKTPNGLINIAKPLEFDEKAFWENLERLRIEAERETEEMKECVQTLVSTYKIDKRS